MLIYLPNEIILIIIEIIIKCNKFSNILRVNKYCNENVMFLLRDTEINLDINNIKIFKNQNISKLSLINLNENNTYLLQYLPKNILELNLSSNNIISWNYILFLAASEAATFLKLLNIRNIAISIPTDKTLYIQLYSIEFSRINKKKYLPYLKINTFNNLNELKISSFYNKIFDYKRIINFKNSNNSLSAPNLKKVNIINEFQNISILL